MKRYALIVGLCLMLSGCESDGMPSADEFILKTIKQFQADGSPSGHCESRAIFDDGIKLPYHLLVCKD